jgi:hypothetical protein
MDEATMSDRHTAICDAIDEAEKADRWTALQQKYAENAATMHEIESTMLTFAEHIKYPLARPDKQGRHAVLMMNYLPDLPDTLAYHFTRLGWRWHPEKALVKQRRVVGGLFDDLVTYVDPSEPDEPIIVERDEPPPIDPNLWPVKPRVNIVDEERPPDYD